MTKPTAQELNAINLSEKMKLFNGHSDREYFNLPAGKEHYRLLHWFGEQPGKEIIELGTFRGISALALSGDRHVTTFDITNHDKAVWTYLIKKYLEQIYDGDIEPILFHAADLIFLDTVHDGINERYVFDHLIKINWKGILILDDIHWNKEMNDFWNGIKLRKEDWTDIGHWSGTGIVFFE